MAEPLVNLFGPVDTVVGPYIEYVLLVLLVVNIGARALEYERIKSQVAEGGADAVSRHPVRIATNVLLLVGAFYYMTVHHHGGMVFSIIVLGLFLTDLFEFESRKVEARREIDIERPKGAIAASILALMYIGYQTLFFIIKPVWSSIV
ncbi:DUF7313 family protein [Haloglomus halophilum]|jgi:hypothetical protein|uniref:DUF7313 family protein n=1 Tax=Haloglomus halophilum TaxID=2962672 RepID=UPI0020C9BBDD|nr:hypothetical protein [Haloglomus halophilum]